MDENRIREEKNFYLRMLLPVIALFLSPWMHEGVLTMRFLYNCFSVLFGGEFSAMVEYFTYNLVQIIFEICIDYVYYCDVLMIVLCFVYS